MAKSKEKSLEIETTYPVLTKENDMRRN